MFYTVLLWLPIHLVLVEVSTWATLGNDNTELYEIQLVPRSKHSVTIIKIGQLMYGKIIVVCSQIHTQHINTLCGQNVEFVNVKPSGT